MHRQSHLVIFGFDLIDPRLAAFGVTRQTLPDDVRERLPAELWSNRLWRGNFPQTERQDLGDTLANRLVTFVHVATNVEHRGVLQTREVRSEEHTSELQSRDNLVCRLLLV